MTFIRHLRCDSCGRAESMESARIYYYLLANGLRIASSELAIWCFDCDGVRSSEVLRTLEFFENDLTEFAANGIDEANLREKASFLRMEIDPQKEYESELASRRAALEWRAGRRSPPRCLTCGGMNHRIFESPGDRPEHPGCGGRFLVELLAHGSQATYREVDSEGNLRDT